VFGVGEAAKWQRTENYTLIGEVATGRSSMEGALVRPLNLNDNGSMEGVNSIVWLALIGGRSCVIKGILPYSTNEGYQHEFTSHESEFKVPLSIPPHPHIVQILHQFTGSSVLIYPWISQTMKTLNDARLESSGKRFIRRFTTYVVMEYFPSTLKRHVKELKAKHKGIVPERDLVVIALQLLRAVEHLHTHKVAHRDIKDDNVFVSQDGKLVLADFGCAENFDDRVFQSVDDVIQRLGCPAATAPEIHVAIKQGVTRNSDGSKKSLWSIFEKNDVYAVGMTLYNMIGTHVPLRSDRKYTAADIPIASNYSETVNFLLQSLVAYDPKERFSASQAVKSCSLLLWGPPYDVIESGSEGIRKWLFNRQLDLVFNVCDKDEITEVGCLLPNPQWPIKKGTVERIECSRWFAHLTADDISDCVGSL
jgi:serine/threonine protein kinase